jgi:hypothetical protein|tara:strand:- start:18 stop:191 length:174 start_codon:yes stop_codon:yes gene_type:complete
MAYPFDNDDDFDGSYTYGLNENQIRERMNYAINGEDDSDDYSLDFGDLEDEEPEDDD